MNLKIQLKDPNCQEIRKKLKEVIDSIKDEDIIRIAINIQKCIEENGEGKLEKIKDIISQPIDRISKITLEDYERIRQAIFKVIEE